MIKLMWMVIASVMFLPTFALAWAESTSLQSTRTCSAESNLLVATGSIKVISIVITSTPTTSAIIKSQLTIHDSTTSSSGGYNPNTSTFTSVDTSAIFQYNYNHNTSSGMVVNKVGNACTEIHWIFVDPMAELETLFGRSPPLSDYKP